MIPPAETWEHFVNLNTAMPILVVDDYQTMVKIVRNLLKQIGYENVDDAPNGEVALEKIKAKDYGLVISDWNMEPMGGLELLRRVREEAQKRDMRFLMVTAESKTEYKLAAREAGVNSYLVKPFNAQTLRNKIEAACAA